VVDMVDVAMLAVSAQRPTTMAFMSAFPRSARNTRGGSMVDMVDLVDLDETVAMLIRAPWSAGLECRGTHRGGCDGLGRTRSGFWRRQVHHVHHVHHDSFN
jgi:hypothetical protein